MSQKIIPESLLDFPSVKKYLERINAEERSLLKAVVKQEQANGYWLDIALIRFSKGGEINAPIEYLPTEEEQKTIQLEMSNAEWPENVAIPEDISLPKIITEAKPEDCFYFRTTSGEITMIQVRKEQKGKKSYIPVTYWSDGKFRYLEPEGNLPLFGLENLKDNTTVLIVEGAKVARYVQWLADAKTPEAKKAQEEHPWGKELSNLCVLGWCSGALSPDRTEWGILRKHGITRAYVALDNDAPGIAALPKISKQLNCVTYSIEFSEEWPVSADLYDPFPEVFFREIDGKRFYIGPSFRNCCKPATYLTNVAMVETAEGKNKPVPVLRPHARNQWIYIEDSEVFVHSENPDLILKPDSLNAKMYPFADTKKVSELFLGTYTGHITKLAYKPSTTKRKIITHGETALNLYTPSDIKPQSGSPAPWLEFLSQLIPDDKECYEIQRWAATLIARPDVRMIYGLLMISKETGTGKSTFGKILARIVGMHNASFPSEKTISGDFNSWLARKRLVVVSEIFASNSWKVANNLKELITEETISMRLMYQNPIDMDNYAHFLAFSNHLQALKIEDTDRRWYIPTVTEKRWPDHKFIEFHKWIESGGLSIIAHWAENFGDYVQIGEKSPMSERKSEIIEASRSRASIRIMELAQVISEKNEPIAIGDKDILSWLEAITKDKVYESAFEIRKMMKKKNISEAKELRIERLWLTGQLQNILLNEEAAKQLSQIDEEHRKEVIKSFLKRPVELINIEADL